MEKLQKVSEKGNVEAAESDVIFGGFRRAESVVKLDYELAIHHADFVDDEVSTMGPFQLLFPAHLVCSVAFRNWHAQGAVQRISLDVEGLSKPSQSTLSSDL